MFYHLSDSVLSHSFLSADTQYTKSVCSAFPMSNPTTAVWSEKSEEAIEKIPVLKVIIKRPSINQMHWHATSGKVVMYLFPEEQLYSLQQLKMNKGSPSPPPPHSACAQCSEVRKEMGRNILLLPLLRSGNVLCCGWMLHSVTRAADSVTIPSSGALV